MALLLSRGADKDLVNEEGVAVLSAAFLNVCTMQAWLLRTLTLRPRCGCARNSTAPSDVRALCSLLQVIQL